MQLSTEWIEIQPGNRKFFHVWAPNVPPQAVVCIVHGLGEHGGRYHRLARDFSNAGIAVVAFDQQGHGQSVERRGCIKSYDSLLADIEAAQSWARGKFPDLPVVLFGHSMGGNLVINYLLRDLPRPEGAISSSPMIEAANPPGWLFEQLARMLAVATPNLCLKSTVIPARLMSDPEEQLELEQDELFHSQLSLRLGVGLFDSGSWALENAQQLRHPLLLSHGTRDSLTSPAASTEFARRAGSMCQLKIFEGQLHDPFRDLERESVIAHYVSFIRGLANTEGSQ
jgi:alpha-beta hydrolase superfamily lysophospholipase